MPAIGKSGNCSPHILFRKLEEMSEKLTGRADACAQRLKGGEGRRALPFSP